MVRPVSPTRVNALSQITKFDIFADEVRKISARVLSPMSSERSRFVRPIVERLSGPRMPVRTVSAQDLTSDVNASDNGGGFRRDDPGTILGSNWAIQYMQRMNEVEVVVPPSGTARIANAIVCGEGLVCKDTADGVVLVKESLRNAIHHRSILPFHREADGSLFLNRRPKPRRTIKGPAVLMRQIWDTNYGHWMLEVLPWIAIVAEHYDLSKLQILVSYSSPGMRKIYEVTLGHFGIKPEQIVHMLRQPVLVEDLIFALPMSRQPPWVFAPRSIAILEDLGRRVADGVEGPRRIYVSRKGAGQRHLINEAEIIEVLAPYGFTTIYLDGLSFTDQVKSFSGADFIVGNYGANLTNAVFSKRGQTMFALTSENMMDDFFWTQTGLKGGRYVSLHGKGVGEKPDLNADFTIDIPTFRTEMAALLGPA